MAGLATYPDDASVPFRTLVFFYSYRPKTRLPMGSQWAASTWQELIMWHKNHVIEMEFELWPMSGPEPMAVHQKVEGRTKLSTKKCSIKRNNSRVGALKESSPHAVSPWIHREAGNLAPMLFKQQPFQHQQKSTSALGACNPAQGLWEAPPLSGRPTL